MNLLGHNGQIKDWLAMYPELVGQHLTLSTFCINSIETE